MSTDWIQEQIRQAKRIWLFLDYDGTLAEFAPTPDDVYPDPQLIDLFAGLARDKRLRVAVISGRRLDHVIRLIPLQGIWLAGAYGVELRSPQGKIIERAPFALIRPILDRLKPRWEQLISGQNGFYLEDKGWSLALHARDAEDSLAERVLRAARELAVEQASLGLEQPGQMPSAPTVDLFRWLGGYKFGEFCPGVADKGRTVEYLLGEYPWPEALPVYLGDDDKDEAAYAAIQNHRGLAGLVVAQQRQPTRANFRLENPAEARRWLAELQRRME